MNDQIKDAMRVTKHGADPTYDRRHYEDAMMKLAADEAGPRESTALAFARLCEEREPRIEALYSAASRADVLKADPVGAPTMEEKVRKRAQVWQLMQRTARLEKRAGESDEQALERLLETDKVVQDCYALYCEEMA